MSPQGAVAHAIRSVRMLVLILLVVVVVGFAVAGYEINHQRSEISGLKSQVNELNLQVQKLDSATALLQAAIKSVANGGK